MINLTYDSRVVLALFAQANPGKLNPAAASIVSFDNQLKSANEATLQQAMGQFGIPFTSANKSQILLYQPSMPGNTSTMQIQNACTFFQNTASILGTPVTAMTATRKAASPKKAGAKKKAARTRAT